MDKAIDGFIDNLEMFNRKERFFLIGKTLGNSNFEISKEFRDELGEKIGVNIPEQSFNAMDYHIDWIYASLCTAFPLDRSKTYKNTENKIKGTQEDVDFLVAFKYENKCHLVMIEAKGVTGWLNKQMESKAKRLELIFGRDNKLWVNIVPHFVLISPTKPEKLDYSPFPDWMKPNNDMLWLEMKIKDKLRVARCSQDGKEDKDGTHWKVVEG